MRSPRRDLDALTLALALTLTLTLFLTLTLTLTRYADLDALTNILMRQAALATAKQTLHQVR